MTKLEKILTLMRDSKDECEVFIKCYDVNRFIVVRQILAKFNNHARINIKYIENKYNNHINNGNDVLIIRLKKYRDIIEIENAYPMINYDESKAYTDTDVLEEYKEPRAIHDAVIYNPNKNVDAMLGNFFEVLNEIANQEQIKINPKGNKMIKVFSHKKLNIRKVISEIVLTKSVETRPFVHKIIEEELLNITSVINDLDLSVEPKTFNLKLLYAYKHIKGFKDDESRKVIDTDEAYLYYVYEKETKRESNPKTKVDHSWIEKCLTHENLEKEKPFVIFESKNFSFWIENGRIFMHTLETGLIINLDIKYNEETNTFHL